MCVITDNLFNQKCKIKSVCYKELEIRYMIEFYKQYGNSSKNGLRNM